MKKLFTLIAFAITIVASAQAPQGFNYQATVRNNSGQLLVNQIVLVKFKILQNSSTGTIVYSETQTANTDDLGHIALVVGQGTATVGTFASIYWASGTYYMGIELNTGTGYVEMGTTQLLSVPYALYANSSGNSQATTPNLANVLAVNNGANSLQIKNLADPTDPQDAVTKSYSDLQLQTQISNLQQQITNSLIAQYPAGSVFCATGPTQIVPVLNPITGKVWMDRNLGARRVATSISDVNAFGDFYQWGRGADGHQCANSSTTNRLSSTDQPANANFILAPSSNFDWRSPENINLWQGVNGINNPCPNGYRIPTKAEWTAEINSWNGGNASSSLLKLTISGNRRWDNGEIENINIRGSYWSSSTDGGAGSHYLEFDNNSSGADYSYPRSYGRCVRCIKN